MTIITATEIIEAFTTANQHWNAEAALGCYPLCARTPILNLALPVPLIECVPWPGLGVRPEAITRSDWVEIVEHFKDNEMWGGDSATLCVLQTAHPFLADPRSFYGDKLSFCPSAAQTSRFLLDHGFRFPPSSALCKMFRVTFALYLLAARLVTSSQWSAPEPTWGCDPVSATRPRLSAPHHKAPADAI